MGESAVCPYINTKILIYHTKSKILISISLSNQDKITHLCYFVFAQSLSFFCLAFMLTFYFIISFIFNFHLCFYIEAINYFVF